MLHSYFIGGQHIDVHCRPDMMLCTGICHFELLSNACRTHECVTTGHTRLLQLHFHLNTLSPIVVTIH